MDKVYCRSKFTLKEGLGMFRFLTFVVVIFLVFVFAACSGEKKDEAVHTETHGEETATAGLADCSGSCDMKMEQAKMVAFVQESDTLYFCSDKCKNNYLAAEEKEGDSKEETKKES